MSIYKDKKVLITGASTGIGYALAEELNKRGAEVILTARSENKLHGQINSYFQIGTFTKLWDVYALVKRCLAASRTF